MQVAHANAEARTEQSIAYFELQEQLKQPNLDDSYAEIVNKEVALLTSQILSRSVPPGGRSKLVHVAAAVVCAVRFLFVNGAYGSIPVLLKMHLIWQVRWKLL